VDNNGGSAWERPLRLTTGLVLFGFASSHLTNHMFGIRSLEAMQAASVVLLRPWQSNLGLLLLYGSFVVHGSLGLVALYRRRHLRVSLPERWQLLLGLIIPLLLIPHAVGVRVNFLDGLEITFQSVLYRFWIASPKTSLPWQFLLLVVLWSHGCIGLRAWLCSKSWYRDLAKPLGLVAILVPIIALLGMVTAGFDLRDTVLHDPSKAAALSAAFAEEEAGNSATKRDVANGLSIGYLGLVIGTLALRRARDWRARRFQAVRITYPGHRVVTVPPGFSVLEASRWAAIPHAAVCGGRSRCSTCRIRVIDGLETLAAPQAPELQTLQRIKAPLDVRLACQTRPRTDLSVEPLMPVGKDRPPKAARFEAALTGGRELTIGAMFVDMRDSTRIASGRLPYDVLFLFDRYIQAVTGGVRHNGGRTISIAGDGVMSVFGIDRRPAIAAQDALKAALDVWSGLEALNEEMVHELNQPLSIGIGIYFGLAVVGFVSVDDAQSLQFIGDTGNLAAKLEAETKRLDCTLVVSVSVLSLAAADTSKIERRFVSIPGRADSVEAAVFRKRRDLEGMLATLRKV